MFRRLAVCVPCIFVQRSPMIHGQRMFIRKVAPHGDLYFPHIENLDLVAIRDVLGQNEICDETSSCSNRDEQENQQHVRDGAIASSVVLGALMTEPEGVTAEQRKAAADVMDAAGKLIKTLDKGIYDEDWREFILLFVDRARTVAVDSGDKQLDAAVQRLELSLPY